MSVELGDDDLADFDGIMESFGLRITSLTNTSVHDENGSVRLDGGLDLEHLVEQGLLLLVSTGGIDDDDLVLLLAEEGYALVGDLDRITLVLVPKEGALDLRGVHLELLEGARSERVCANEADPEATFHIAISEFGTSCGLSGALQTDEHHDVGLAPNELIRLVLGSEHPGELVDDVLDDDPAHLLDRVSIRSINLSHLNLNLGLDAPPEFHDVADVDVAVHQGVADLLQDLVDEALVNFLGLLKLLESVAYLFS